MNKDGEAAGGLRLGVPGFSYADLYDPLRLRDLYVEFDRRVRDEAPALWMQWDAYRRAPDAPVSAVERSRLLVEMGRRVGAFVAELFDVAAEASAIRDDTRRQDPLFRFKVDFVRRRVLPLVKSGPVACGPGDEEVVARLVEAEGLRGDPELALASAGCRLLDQEAALASGGTAEAQEAVAAQLQALRRWLGKALGASGDRAASDGRDGETEASQKSSCADWALFRFPRTRDPHHLVEIERPDASLPQAIAGPPVRRRLRDGFTLTDTRMPVRGVLSEIHYCVICHERDKDSCSKGLLDKNGAPATNVLGIPLAGCPLGEKISEMHLLRKEGDPLGALALVALDNPMCAGTGHRICNDCMKACIYQKQDPVDIPQVETGVLTDVLRLPWGLEIYGLLTRWNPLNVRRPYPLPYNGENVFVVGLGPAGYTLAHYLLNEGFGVVGIDGLKIEPLPAAWTGGDTRAPEPIRDWAAVYRRLDERVLEGFGGVSEYGITVRWDKNFLTLIHLLLARRARFRAYGGIRFGGTVSLEDAWALGFSHVAIAAGAGRPTIIGMKNNLIRGVRKASDFLMALQLTGAFKEESLANLQVRLPAVVIGGGLTAIDTATELLAYYPRQVEKILRRYEDLAATIDESRLQSACDAEELEQLEEFLVHGRAVRAERERAASAGVAPDFGPLLREWGGVSVVYRKRMVDSPAYRLNHEEVEKALEEGIVFVENLDPREVIADQHGHARAVRFRLVADEAGPAPASTHVELRARAVLVAAGTSPNIAYEKEHSGTFTLDAGGRFFQPHRPVTNGDGTFRLEPDPAGFFTSYQSCGRFVSYYGDNHPRYAGNVVKAMASARDGYREVVRLFESRLACIDPAGQPLRDAAWRSLVTRLDDDFEARVVEVKRLAPAIVELVVRAPAAARHFRPGQFYRLQNFEQDALTAGWNGSQAKLVMEGIALTGAWVDPEHGILSLIALELGVSSRLCAYLRPGQHVVVMGPTGAPTEIPTGENVLLAGGGLGNAVLFSIARAMKDAGNRVVYFAGYRKGEDLFKREEIEAVTDQVIWSTDGESPISPRREQDRHFRGNIVDAMLSYARGELGPPAVPLSSVDRILAIGSDRMMAAVKGARYGVLAPYLKQGHVAIASINSPMQCMLKEVCAQCLQKHVDPETGRESVIFSCFNQDQLMDSVDFCNLNARLRQNTVQEKLTNQWLEQVLQR